MRANQNPPPGRGWYVLLSGHVVSFATNGLVYAAVHYTLGKKGGGVWTPTS
jgi:hypothetical protein